MEPINWANFEKVDIRVGPFMSECLVTGLHRADGSVVLSTVDRDVPNGTRLA